MEIYKVKQALRKDMAARKKEYSRTTLHELSDKIMNRLEQTTLFQAASCVALYHAIEGEVQTAAFIEKWFREKQILLPLITGDNLRMLLYEGKDSLCPGPFGIWEPKASCREIRAQDIDVIVVPGVAFDPERNRMGRGKGFYDRLLATTHAAKIGICFGFQLLPHIPVEPFDQKMDLVITENEIFGA